ncbi:MAG: hypothetical protein H7124_17455 [Phycisphaerales bacterium]|nr:hypothetical protein [Hyphomonadaceae bacterium]
MQTPAHSSAIAHLWRAARAMFERMRAVIGEAAAIASRPALDAEEITTARAWLRSLELMVRKLVLIEAMALAVKSRLPRMSNTVEIRQYAPPKPAGPKRAPSYSFKLWPRPPTPPARIRILGKPVLVREIWRERDRAAAARRLNMVRFMRTPEPQRIARRIEALSRVLNKPEYAARRLARRLRTTPTTAHAIVLQRPPRTSYADPNAESETGRRAFASLRRDTS